MHLRDELLKAIVEVFTIRKLSPENSQYTSKSIAWVDFPRGIRIGCDRNTHAPVFEFGDQKAEAKLVTQLQRKSPTKSERTTQTSASTGQQGKGETQVYLEPEHTEPANDIFRFADLADQDYGKWSSISLEDLRTRFAV